MVPSHFRVSISLEGESWTLKVTAHVNGGSCVVGELAGVLAGVHDVMEAA
jgi:hypothetical protein